MYFESSVKVLCKNFLLTLKDSLCSLMHTEQGTSFLKIFCETGVFARRSSR